MRGGVFRMEISRDFRGHQSVTRFWELSELSSFPPHSPKQPCGWKGVQVAAAAWDAGHFPPCPPSAAIGCFLKEVNTLITPPSHHHLIPPGHLLPEGPHPLRVS